MFEENKKAPVLGKKWLIIPVVLMFLVLVIVDYSTQFDKQGDISGDDDRVMLNIGAALFWLLCMTLVVVGAIKVTEFMGKT